VSLLPFPGGIATTEGVRHAIASRLESLPRPLRRTLTWVRASSSDVQQITAVTATGVFLCDVHSRWQRVSNENMYGLLRDYCPKAPISAFTPPRNIARIAAEVNHRPRKTLGRQRPATVFNAGVTTTA
jgi:transposase, IS30 family